MKTTEKEAVMPTNGDQSEQRPSAGEVASTEGRSRLFSAGVPFAIVIALTLLSGIVHGIIDGRWTQSEDLIAQGSKLLDAPAKVGDWTLVETRELDEGAANMLRCHGEMVRVYHHETNDIDVTVAILFGPRGPIAVHTPEVCYNSIGTTQVGGRKTQTVKHGAGEDRFWSVKFAEDPSPDASMDVWYGWSDGDGWVAAEHPRFWMVENLYKLQIAGPVGTASFRPCKEFLTEFLPAVEPLIKPGVSAVSK